MQEIQTTFYTLKSDYRKSMIEEYEKIRKESEYMFYNCTEMSPELLINNLSEGVSTNHGMQVFKYQTTKTINPNYRKIFKSECLHYQLLENDQDNFEIDQIPPKLSYRRYGEYLDDSFDSLYD